METLPGYDDWKLRGPEEEEIPLLVYDHMKAPLSNIPELQTDGDEECWLGEEDTFQNISLRYGKLARDNDEALDQLAERLEQTLAIVNAKRHGRTIKQE